jgi:hypothetical protein
MPVKLTPNSRKTRRKNLFRNFQKDMGEKGKAVARAKEKAKERGRASRTPRRRNFAGPAAPRHRDISPV